MPYRRTSTTEDVSLFPFLSIIACVIGVLTMMIATLALAQTDTQDVALVEAFEATNRALSSTQSRIESLRRQIDETGSTALNIREQQQELEAIVKELDRLQEETKKVDLELGRRQQVKVVIPEFDPAMQQKLAELKSQYEKLQQQIKRLQAELLTRQQATEAQVTILPQGSGLDFDPSFVECAAGSVVMHHLSPPKRIRAAEITTDSDFSQLLETATNDQNNTIIFLIRDDGLSVYQACKRLCDERGIRNGKLPVVGKGRIDLSAFAVGDPETEAKQ